jgi:hypothetical protein
MAASGAEAQRLEDPWYVEGFGNYVLGTGAFASAVENGWSAGGLLGYRLSAAWLVMAGASYAWWSGERGQVDWNTTSYFGQVGYDAARAAGSTRVILIAGAGATSFAPESEIVGSETYLALNGGLKVVQMFGRRFGATLNMIATVAFADEQASQFDSATWSFPFGVGLSIRF